MANWRLIAIRDFLALLFGFLACSYIQAQTVTDAPAGNQQKAESDYAAMLARVQQGDMSVDFRAFRSAGAQKSGPHASMIEVGERNAFGKLATAGDWAGALASAKQALDRDYASLVAHYNAMLACTKLQQADEAASHEKILNALLDSIRQSGDGKSAETAYFVVTGQEEYVFLARAFTSGLRSQSLVGKGGHYFDCLHVIDPATNQPRDVWFNADFDFGEELANLKPKDGIHATASVTPAQTPQGSPGPEAPSGQAQASQPADPIGILNQAALIYRGASSLQLKGVKMYERHDEFIDTVTRTPFLLILAPDNRYRQESRSAAGTDLQVCNGLTNWHYMARTNKYSSAPGIPDPINLFNSRIDPRFLNEHLITAELLRQETSQTATGDHLCDVIQAHYERTQQPRNVDFGDVLYWVDHSAYLVWKTRTQVDTELGQSGAKASGFETTIYNDVQLNVNLQAEAFTFIPPPGATPQNVGNVGGREALLGRPAPDFTLRDLEGNQIQLLALKGRVILLDFWATWCGPCRSTMPKLNSLFKKFRKRDVVVLGVDMHENEQAVRGFVSKNRYEYPILLSPRGDPVFDSYFARAIPTLVVIDKNGLVADYKVGYGSETEEMLRDDLVRVLSKEYVTPKPVAAPTSALVR